MPKSKVVWAADWQGLLPGSEQGAELSAHPLCPQAQQAKFLSSVENELEELAVTITQTKKMVELIKVTTMAPLR